MKVLNLQCGSSHCFEGWFGSEDDFQQQLARGLVECPLCADKAVVKLPSAPRLNLGAHAARDSQQTASPDGGQHASPAAAPPTPVDAVAPAAADPAVQAAFLKALRQVVASTEDVGERFADEARRMHYGDAEARSIRGQASLQQTAELLEEGIEVMPLPLPAALKETLQ